MTTQRRRAECAEEPVLEKRGRRASTNRGCRFRHVGVLLVGLAAGRGAAEMPRGQRNRAARTERREPGHRVHDVYSLRVSRIPERCIPVYFFIFDFRLVASAVWSSEPRMRVCNWFRFVCTYLCALRGCQFVRSCNEDRC